MSGHLPQLRHHGGLYLVRERPQTQSALARDRLSELTDVRETPVVLTTGSPRAAVARDRRRVRERLPADVHEVSDGNDSAQRDARTLRHQRAKLVAGV